MQHFQRRTLGFRRCSLLTRADDCFDDRLAPNEFVAQRRGQVRERAVRPALIATHTPRFDDGSCISQRGKLVQVQTFVPQAPITRFDEDIFQRFAQSYEVELHASSISPIP